MEDQVTLGEILKLVNLQYQQMDKGIAELKESVTRVHERIDDLRDKDFVQRKDFERHMDRLKTELKEAINQRLQELTKTTMTTTGCELQRKECKKGGVPAWASVALTAFFSLVTGITVYYYTMAVIMQQVINKLK